MEFDKVIEKRHSVRSFKDKKASWEDVMEAIDSAIKNPFAGNQNNIRFIIVENPETIKRLAKFAEQAWIEQAGIVIVVCSNNTHLEKLYGDRGKIYSRQQAGALIQTLILKLTDLGLATCWVGAFSDELVEQLLKIPEDNRIEAIIPVGYEKPEKGKEHKPRKKELANAIFWEQWYSTKRPMLFAPSKRDVLSAR